MPITAEKIEEAFGYPLLTNAQHEFMTVTVRHHLLTPWYHATKTDETKKEMWDVIHSFRYRVFWHGCLFHFTLEQVQDALLTGVWIEPREDSPKAYGEEALVVIADRCKEEIISTYRRQASNERMTLEDTDTLLKVVRIADKVDRDMRDAFGWPYVDKGWGAVSSIVYYQLEFLKTLESEKKNAD